METKVHTHQRQRGRETRGRGGGRGVGKGEFGSRSLQRGSGAGRVGCKDSAALPGGGDACSIHLNVWVNDEDMRKMQSMLS